MATSYWANTSWTGGWDTTTGVNTRFEPHTIQTSKGTFKVVPGAKKTPEAIADEIDTLSYMLKDMTGREAQEKYPNIVWLHNRVAAICSKGR